jgi:hypothetical protein
MLPAAFLSVTMYWVCKAFERADRFLALYAMETQAIPFQLRDLMVKCWKRHRDVPTKRSELVDRAVDDLQRRQMSAGLETTHEQKYPQSLTLRQSYRSS